MNKKAEFTIQGMMIGLLTFGLFFSIIALSLGNLGSNYDISDIDISKIENYQVMDSLKTDIASAEAQIDTVTPEKDAFDFFSNIWSKVTTPFKTIYRSFGIMKNVAGIVVSDLHLNKIIADYLITVITVLVIIGIVLIKYYLGRNK